MLGRIRMLAKNGEWVEVLRLAPAVLASISGDDAARAHLYISAAYASTAACPEDWQKALSHAFDAYYLASPGGMVHTWALQKLTSLLVDTGRYQTAKSFAHSYLTVVDAHPALRPFTPYVYKALGRIAFSEGNYNSAGVHYLKAHALFVEVQNDAEEWRTSLNVVWATAKAGRMAEARHWLPQDAPEGMEYLLDGAKSVVSACEGNWAKCVEYGRRALQGSRLAHDYVDAAEVSLLVARAYAALGQYGEAMAYSQNAAFLANRQNHTAIALVALTLRSKGGEYSETATSSCGAYGCYLDSVFTTGVG